ncbi:MAG: hypothetical protein ACKVQK_03665 [Burkholderiales bacterium]
MSDATRLEVRVDAEMQAIVPKYLANRGKDCTLLRELASRGALEDAKRLGHNMKGTGGGYGFDEISRLGDLIEIAAMTGDAKAIHSLSDELDVYLAKLYVIYE